MADRHAVTAALRSQDRWVIDRMGCGFMILRTQDWSEELDIEYGITGRITRAVHWEPIGMGGASRQPIDRDKRQRVLDIIGEDQHAQPQRVR